MYSPCTLWYFGNGYVNIDIQMPFIISFFLLIVPMLQSAENITSKKLLSLILLTLLLVYFDWSHTCNMFYHRRLFIIQNQKTTEIFSSHFFLWEFLLLPELFCSCTIRLVCWLAKDCFLLEVSKIWNEKFWHK